MQGRLTFELDDLQVRLTRVDGGLRAATALSAAYRGERTIVLGFAGVRAARSAALSKLLGQARALLEPWAPQARIELRSLRQPVRRELLCWTSDRDDFAVVAAGRHALTLAPGGWAETRADSCLSTNRRRMLLLAARDGEWCVWCSKRLTHRSPDATVDHVRCRSDGGADALDNLVLACAACNHARSNRSAELWLRHCLAAGREVDERAVAAALLRAARCGRRPRQAAPERAAA